MVAGGKAAMARSRLIEALTMSPGNRVGDIDQAAPGRGVAEQNSLHGGDVPSSEAEVGCEGYNRIGKLAIEESATNGKI